MIEVEKAVLLAAGRGTRLGSLTSATPKPLLHVGRRPIIVHILDGLLAAGIRDATIVTGYLGERIQVELGNGAGNGMALRYVHQESLDGTARALLLAREHLGDSRFFVGWGDVLVRPENYRALVRAARFADAAIAVNEVEDPSAGAAVYVDDDMVVHRIIEKPPAGTSSTQWNNAGLAVLGFEIWPYIDALSPSERGEYELPEAVAAFVADGARVVAVPVVGPWFDIGTPETLEAARAAWAAT